MSRRFIPPPAERLFQNAPASGRDVDIANFYLRKVGEGEVVDKDSLADLLAAYRIEQEDKYEDQIGALQDEILRLEDKFAEGRSREDDDRSREDYE